MKITTLLMTLLLLASNSRADTKNVSLLGCLDCFNFVAPTIAGAENVNPPEIGLIVYDSTADLFRGFTSSGLWATLSRKNSILTAFDGTFSVGSYDEILGDAGSDGVNINLPAAAVSSGKEITIKKIDSSLFPVRIVPAGSDLVEGKNPFLLMMKNESLKIVSTGVRWEILSHHIPPEWVSYVPDFYGFGTVSGVDCAYRRSGPDLIVRCKFNAGTTTSAEARVTLPYSSWTAVTLGSTINRVGTWINGTIGSYSYPVLIENGVSYLTFSSGTSSGTGLTKFPGNGIASLGNVINFNDVVIPMAAWQ